MVRDKLNRNGDKGNRQPSRPQSQRCHNKNKSEITTARSKRKSLSLSFYNQQTLEGSKKIMLDLLPIQNVQTEYKSCSYRGEVAKLVKFKPKSFTDKKKPEQCQKNMVLKVKASNKKTPVKEKRKNSLDILPSRRKNSFNLIESLNTTNQKCKTTLTKPQTHRKTPLREQYLEKYLNGCLKKAQPSK